MALKDLAREFDGLTVTLRFRFDRPSSIEEELAIIKSVAELLGKRDGCPVARHVKFGVKGVSQDLQAMWLTSQMMLALQENSRR